MNRRKFLVSTSSSLAVASALQVERAQADAPDASLLTTTLTPMGAERAGNADGSIPAWTGGMTSPALPITENIFVKSAFGDEQKLYTVNASNLAQYQDLVPPGLSAMVTKQGFVINVFPSHRSAAVPQYVYDNAAKNVTRAVLNPAGGRLGFTGAFGGPPFPIINTTDPLVGGAQLIWNHLTVWGGYMNLTTFAAAIVVSNGHQVLANSTKGRFVYPYYDPNGTPETYEGYYSKLHLYTIAPPAEVGQETLVWHTTNVNVAPDITWGLLNGQGRVRKDPDEAFDAPNPSYNGISNIDESQCFYGNPSQYDWTYIGKKEILLPYNNNDMVWMDAAEYCKPSGPDGEMMRFEKHRVWVVEANLHPGERNVLPKRRFYLDEDTWNAQLGEAYDADGNLIRTYMVPSKYVPSVPMTNPMFILVISLQTGDYAYQGNMSYKGTACVEYNSPQASSFFDPQEMAASASY